MPSIGLQPGDPSELGPYRLLSRLGSGGMGVVFHGVNASGQGAAVKTLLVGSEPDGRARMEREVAALSAVSHPRIPRYLGADLTGPTPWLAMAYIQGPSLAEVTVPLAPGPLQLTASGLADALVALHAAGVVHRDLKPSNVILTFDGAVLVDLGIAKGVSTGTLTQAGTVIGSPGWMSPEQLLDGPVGPWTDVWGWASLVTYAATGRAPFGAGDPAAMGWRILNTDPDLSRIPPALLAIVAGCLQKVPSLRPDARAVATACARLAPTVATVAPSTRTSAPDRDGQGPAAPPFPTPTIAAPLTVPTVLHQPDSATSVLMPRAAGHGPGRGRVTGSGLLVAAVLALAIGGGVWYLMQDANPAGTAAAQDSSRAGTDTTPGTTGEKTPTSAPSSESPSPGTPTGETGRIRHRGQRAGGLVVR